MVNKVFRNSTLLSEVIDKDLIDSSEEIRKIKGKLKKLALRSNNVFIAFIGPFGSGKTTILSEVVKSQNFATFQFFNLWSYSDRHKLWDGFVLETIVTMQKRRDEKAAIREIDGKKRINIKLLIFAVFVCYLLSYFIWKLLGSFETDFAQFNIAFLKYSLSTIIVVFAFFGIDKLLPRSLDPLERIVQLKAKISSEFSELDKPHIIIVDDVDRVGEEGLVFSETLRDFLLTNKFPHPVIVIFPQDSYNFNPTSSPNSTGFSRSIKLYDYEWYKNKDDLIEKIGLYLEKLRIYEEYKNEFESTVKSLLETYSDQISFRLVKYVFRAVEDFVSTYNEANPSVAFILIMSRYVKVNIKYNNEGQVELASQNLLRIQKIDWDVAAPFYRSLSAICGKTANDYVVTFIRQLEEITCLVDKHPSGASTGNIFISEKYKVLVEGKTI